MAHGRPWESPYSYTGNNPINRYDPDGKYGRSFEIIEENENELINIFETDWLKKVNQSTNPGESIRIYRRNKGLTQAELGMRLGNYTKQHISDMEHSRRSISKEVAKKLSKIFNVPVERFL